MAFADCMQWSHGFQAPYPCIPAFQALQEHASTTNSHVAEQAGVFVSEGGHSIQLCPYRPPASVNLFGAAKTPLKSCPAFL